jgi:hypothetical protein
MRGGTHSRLYSDAVAEILRGTCVFGPSQQPPDPAAAGRSRPALAAPRDAECMPPTPHVSIFRAVPGLFDRRLIFVTGKGGVGKSTVATALGLLAARQGLRTVVAELASQERVQRAFDHEGQRFREVELTGGLFTISIDPQSAMEEYLMVKTGPLGHMLGSSRLFHAFAMATPGMRELLSVGKIWELAQLERRAPRRRSPTSPGSGRSPIRDGRSRPRSPTDRLRRWSRSRRQRRCR